MAVGFPTKVTYADGDVFSASDINDTNGTLNLLGSSVAYAAGKNAIINADFGVWQRGTSFSNPNSAAYSADRFRIEYDGTAATRTVSQQTFSPGTAPVSGYNGTFFFRCATTAAGVGNTLIWLRQPIEDVRKFAGQTVTVSFWAKADSARTLPVVGFQQVFGSGGSGDVFNDGTSQAITTSWARYTQSISIASISGKTIGTSSSLILYIKFPTGVATIDIWGIQVEQGSTATAFQTSTGTIQGELSACQRYYQKSYNQSDAPGTSTASGAYFSVTASTQADPHNVNPRFPVVMRTSPTVTWYSTDGTINRIRNNSAGTNLTVTAIFDIGESEAGFPATSASIASGQQLRGHYTASAEL